MWCSPPSTSAYLAELKPGKIEEGQKVPVADIEEEVGRTPVVAVLEQLGQRELEHILIEPDGPFDVTRQQGEMVQTAGR